MPKKSTPTPTPTVVHRYYTVQAGDSLWSISRKLGVTVNTLARVNKLKSNSQIEIGQILMIPTPEEESDIKLPSVEPSLGAPKQQPLTKLAPKLVAYLRSRGGVSAASIYVPATNTIYSWNSKTTFYTASTVKVPIMYTQLSEQYAKNPHTTSPGTDMLVSMITASDNDAATTLLQHVGGASAVQKELRELGLKSTHIDGAHWGLSTTTAPDMARLMRSLYYGVSLNDSLRGVAFGLLSDVIESERWGVPDGLPKGADVAFKGGWLPVANGWVVHQVGVIRWQGHNYIFSFYNKQQPTLGYGQETLRRSAQLFTQEVLK